MKFHEVETKAIGPDGNLTTAKVTVSEPGYVNGRRMWKGLSLPGFPPQANLAGTPLAGLDLKAASTGERTRGASIQATKPAAAEISNIPIPDSESGENVGRFKAEALSGGRIAHLAPSVRRRGRPPGVRANGEIIRRLRGITQDALANYAGLDTSSIQRAERGQAMSAFTLGLIAAGLTALTKSPTSLDDLKK